MPNTDQTTLLLSACSPSEFTPLCSQPPPSLELVSLVDTLTLYYLPLKYSHFLSLRQLRRRSHVLTFYFRRRSRRPRPSNVRQPLRRVGRRRQAPHLAEEQDDVHTCRLEARSSSTYSRKTCNRAGSEPPPCLRGRLIDDKP